MRRGSWSAARARAPGSTSRRSAGSRRSWGASASQLLGLLPPCGGGHGQVVFVVGEPGIGKSRLLHEFRRQLGDGARWLEGHCVSFGRAMPFQPFIDLLRRTSASRKATRQRAIVAKIEPASPHRQDLAATRRSCVTSSPWIRATRRCHDEPVQRHRRPSRRSPAARRRRRPGPNPRLRGPALDRQCHRGVPRPLVESAALPRCSS